MSNKRNGVSRRDFLRTAGAVGIGSIIAPGNSLADGRKASMPGNMVPTRPFGKTGVHVPLLSLGGVFDPNNHMLMRQAVKMGVTYWDTAAYYPATSEEGIGSYFVKYPEDRRKIFVVTKSTLSDPAGWDYHLERSLERMKTSYVDLFLIHMITSTKKLEPFARSRAWVEKKKAAGKFKFFGFSSHANMEACMTEGAKLGWIDGMMVTYNYRILFADGMKKAVQTCVKAGIGLTAMKTQAAAALGDSGLETRTAVKLTENF